MTVVEKVARAIFFIWHARGWDGDDVSPGEKEDFCIAAKAAIAVLRAEGWRDADEISELIIEESRAAHRDALREADER